MKIGCLINLVLYAALFAGYWFWLSHTLDSPWLWVVSGAAALFSLGALGALYNARMAGRDAAALRSAQQGLPPRGGSWTAVIGTLEPLGEPLQAPFSSQPCVIYEYSIGRDETPYDNDSGTRNRSSPDFSGIAMAPCAVRTAGGDVPLFGFPDLERVPSHGCSGLTQMYRAAQFVHQTAWEDCTGLKVFGGVRGMWQALTEAEPSFRHDWRNIAEDRCDWLTTFYPTPPGLPEDVFSAKGGHVALNIDDASDDNESDDSFDEDDEHFDDDFDASAVAGGSNEFPSLPGRYRPQLSEKRVGVGEKVVAIGYYDPVRGGLASTAKQDGRMLRIHCGEPAAIGRQLGGSRRQLFLGGLVALAVINGMLAVGLLVYRNSDETRRTWRDELGKAVKDSDLPTIRKWLDRGVDVDELGLQGTTPLMEADDPDVIKLLVERGANVNAFDKYGATALIRAVRENRVEALNALIAAGADVNLKDKQYGATALQTAISTERPECIELLRKAGAADDTVTAENGDP